MPLPHPIGTTMSFDVFLHSNDDLSRTIFHFDLHKTEKMSRMHT